MQSRPNGRRPRPRNRQRQLHRHAQAPAATQAAPASKPATPNLKGTSISVLLSAGFVPEADPFFKKQVEEGFVKETGAQVSVEAVANNDVQPKIAASIQAGTGPDIVMLGHNWAHLYKESLATSATWPRTSRRSPASSTRGGRTRRWMASTWRSRAASSARRSTGASRGSKTSAPRSSRRRSTSITRSARS